MAATNEYESHSSQISIKQVSPEKGKGLFANTNFKEGDIIFEEKPLVCCQFLWNAMYKYTACGFCMKSLETAEQMARRLTGNATLELPHAAKCCEIVRSGQKVVNCHRCQVFLVLISCSLFNLYYFAVLDFQKKILGPAGPQVFIFCRQNKYSGRQKLY